MWISGFSLGINNEMVVAGSTSDSLYSTNEGDVDWFTSKSSGCPPGYFFNVNGWQCDPCSPGYFNGDATSGDDVSPCSQCNPGTFSARNGSLNCVSCSEGLYAPEPASSTCYDCDGIRWSDSGFDSCPYYLIELDSTIVLSVALALSISILGLLLFGRPPMAHIVIVILSSLDFITDLLYLVASTFYNSKLFGAAILFLVMPMFHFIYLLFQFALKKQSFHKSLRLVDEINQLFSLPDALLAEYRIRNCSGRPFIGEWSIFPEGIQNVDNLLYFVIYLIAWAIALLISILYTMVDFIYYLPWMVVHIPYYSLLILGPGYLLFQCKLFANRKIRSRWNLLLWKDQDDFEDDRSEVDTKQLNKAIFAELLLETVPQFVIQTTNSRLVRGLGNLFDDPVFVASFVASLMMALTSIYRYTYWMIWMRVPFAKVPLFLDKNNVKLMARHTMNDKGESSQDMFSSLMVSVKAIKSRAPSNASGEEMQQLLNVVDELRSRVENIEERMRGIELVNQLNDRRVDP